MSYSCLIFMLSAVLSAGPSISGTVVNAAGTPVAGARVFLEEGLGGVLKETRSDSSGRFRFDNPALGVAGLVATADGYAFGGRTVSVAVADSIVNATLVLGRPQSVSGRVVDPRGKPVAGARITRVLILGTEKVGVPLAKLRSLGFTEPVTNGDGAFTIPMLPEGAQVALKVGHPDFAQASISDVAVGDSGVRIGMNPGVLVRGQALSRDERLPVANAQIVLTRAVEPHDTVVARTDPSGNFIVRLEPGPYLGQAAAAEFRSPGWERMDISGEAPEQRLTLYVAGMGAVKGGVYDAESGRPIEDAKIILQSGGAPAAHVFTGPTGEYYLDAAEGENVVILDSAAGYLPPSREAVKVRVAQGQVLELPKFWLAPIPAYSVQVVDEAGAPVPGAVVTMVRPAQFGWHVADAQGKVKLNFASLPPDGVVVGVAEDVNRPLGAVFAVDRDKAADAKVRLLPLSSVSGTVYNSRNRELPGAVVGAAFADAPFTDSVVLWQTVAGAKGAYRWDGAVPLVPLKCVAKGPGEEVGESASFTLEPSQDKDLGRIVVAESAPGTSLQGKSLKWRENRHVSGPEPAREGPAVVLYCNGSEAAAVIEGLAVAQSLFAGSGIAFAVVVRDAVSAPNATVPVYQGACPGTATTYVVDSSGKVVLETFGMPPLHVLQKLPAGKS